MSEQPKYHPEHVKVMGHGFPSMCVISGLPLKGPHLYRHITISKDVTLLAGVLARCKPQTEADWSALDKACKAAYNQATRDIQKTTAVTPAGNGGTK